MSCLSSRRQLEVNCCKSTSGYVRYGVPQGSLLDPRLYTIYVNDLPDHVDSGDIYLYADDTMVYNSIIVLVQLLIMSCHH